MKSFACLILSIYVHTYFKARAVVNAKELIVDLPHSIILHGLTTWHETKLFKKSD